MILVNQLIIGTINGSFDLFHEGHKFSITQALKKVDKLILLLNSDQSINLYKGKSRPTENYEIRKNILEIFPQIEIIKPMNLLRLIY